MNTSPVAASKARSFSTVFLIEMWERFGYYGMQALIIYYMVQRLGFSDTRANLTWSAAAALVYVAPAIGGWIGDKVLGTRRTMLIGAVVLAVGYALMVVPSEDVSFLFLALGVIVVGNGLFKANAGNLVRKIYEGDDSRIDSAFTMYYMAVNLGSMFSMLLTPWIKDYVNEHYGNELGWHVAFAVCCVGLAVGLANYFVMRQTMRHIGSEPDHHPLHWGKLGLVALGGVVTVIGAAYVLDHAGVARAFVYLAGLIVAGIFAYLIAAGKRHERPGLAAAVILTVQTMFFFIFYQQMSTSLNLFAGAVPGLQSDLDLHPQPGAGVVLHEGRTQRKGPSDRRQVRARLCRRRGGILHLRRGRPLHHRAGQDLLLDHGVGLRCGGAGGTAGQRPGPGDGGALRALAHGRLPDGGLLRRGGHLDVSGRFRGELRQRARGADRPGPDHADLHQSLPQARHGRYGVHRGRPGLPAGDAPPGRGASRAGIVDRAGLTCVPDEQPDPGADLRRGRDQPRMRPRSVLAECGPASWISARAASIRPQVFHSSTPRTRP